jgi:hypothetical protein
MKDSLYFVGAILIVVCLIFCIMQITGDDWEKAFSSRYSIDFNIYNAMTKEISKLYVVSNVAIGVSGFVSGLLLLALGKIIDLLESISVLGKEPQQEEAPNI